jgi:hypothetical protein
MKQSHKKWQMAAETIGKGRWRVEDEWPNRDMKAWREVQRRSHKPVNLIRVSRVRAPTKRLKSSSVPPNSQLKLWEWTSLLHSAGTRVNRGPKLG